MMSHQPKKVKKTTFYCVCVFSQHEEAPSTLVHMAQVYILSSATVHEKAIIHMLRCSSNIAYCY